MCEETVAIFFGIDKINLRWRAVEIGSDTKSIIGHWNIRKMKKHGTSVCTIAGLCVLNIFTV